LRGGTAARHQVSGSGPRERLDERSCVGIPAALGATLDSALSGEVGVAAKMLLTKAEQVPDDGACAAGLRVWARSRWPDYRFASNGRSDGDGSVGNEAEACDTDPVWSDRLVPGDESVEHAHNNDDRRRGQQIVRPAAVNLCRTDVAT